jgi:hypothetical protein
MAHKLKAYKVKAHKDWNNLQQCMPALITEMINMKKKKLKKCGEPAGTPSQWLSQLHSEQSTPRTQHPHAARPES